MGKGIGWIVVDKNRCKGCGLCVAACPKNVIALGQQVNAKGYCFAGMERENDCIGCANCQAVCPDCCITVYKKTE